MMIHLEVCLDSSKPSVKAKLTETYCVLKIRTVCKLGALEYDYTC